MCIRDRGFASRFRPRLLGYGGHVNATWQILRQASRSPGPAAVHSRRAMSSASGVGKRCRAGGKMLNSLRAVARFFQNKIGWNRIGVLLSVAIITVAVVVLVHMLRGIKAEDVMTALRATEPRHIAAAAAFVAVSYFTLTFYDWFALRTIGRSNI